MTLLELSGLQKLYMFLLRCYPFYTGAGFISNLRLSRFILGKKSGLIWAKLHNKMRVLVFNDDWSGRSVILMGDDDRKVTWLLSKVLLDGDTVLDIGANMGYVSLYLSHLVGDRGRVYSFEPNPNLVDLMTRSIKKNKLKNITVFPVALGEEEGELPLSIPDGHTGMASLSRTFSHRAINTVRVPVRTLQTCLDSDLIGPVKLVKIDVEGFEWQVLKGSASFFSGTKPELILFEHNDPSSLFVASKIHAFLSELNYVFFVIPKRFFSMSIIALGSAGKVDYNDVLAIREDCVEAVSKRLSIEGYKK